MQNPYLVLLKTCWQYAKKEKKKYLLIYTLFLFANVINSLNPIIYGWFVDGIQRDSAAVLQNVWIYGGVYLLLQLSEWIFHGPARVMERDLAFSISRNFLGEMYQKVLSLPVKWHQNNHSGSTINRIRKAYDALKDFFQNGFMYLHALAKLVFSFIAMAYFTPLFGTIGLVLGIFTIWVIYKFDIYYIKSLDEVNEKEHVVSSTVFDSLSNIISVITLRLESRIHKSLMHKLDQVQPPFRKNTIINEWKWFTASMLIACIYVIIIVGYVYQHYEPGKIFYVGGLVILLGYINQFTSSFFDIAWQYTDIVRANTEVQTSKNINEAFEENSNEISFEHLPNNWKNIVIQNLSFSHNIDDPEAEVLILKDIEINIEKGKKIAFIGESGSGKSTLMAVMRGLFQPNPGCLVIVDGDENYNLQSLAHEVTLFPQEPEIFENTIKYNITLGLPFDEKELSEVCNIAEFEEVVNQLPNGYDSNIQEKGVNLSGGQKQRLSISRGILAAKDSQFVFMDEPTSSVDPKTEALIYEKMFDAFANKTIISSLHRLHLLTRFDYIYVLDKGQIVEQGNLENLKQNGKFFNELWKHQLEKG
jgi:ATP-binding cassette, subfamily B, bacterial